MAHEAMRAIPRVIHCCWLGGGPKDALAKRCRASWLRFASDFVLREWDVAAVERTGVAVPPFFRDAMAAHKWAFAADWVRFLALYREGGLYFDYDFELVAPIDDLLADGPFVAGQWTPDGSVAMEPAIMALERGSPVARSMLDYYRTAAFDATTTVGEILAGRLSEVSEGRPRVLAPEFLSPIDVRGRCHRTDRTRGIHHYAMSWATPRRQFARWLAWHGLRGPVEWLLRQRGK